MIKAGLFIKDNFQAGKEDLLERMARWFEHKSEAVVVKDYGATQGRNKRRNIKDTRDEGSKKDMARK